MTWNDLHAALRLTPKGHSSLSSGLETVHPNQDWAGSTPE